MKVDRDAKTFVSNWIDYILTNAHITEEFEYDIVDEYDETIEKIEMPVNYLIKEEEKKVFIISINTEGLEQHKKHRQY